MVTDNTNQADDTTAFLRAARSGNLERILEYLDTELDINTANSNGLNALHLASKDGHVEIVTELLKRGARVDAATKKGNTALHIASLAGQAEIVNILLQYGSTVNIQSQNGFTPLYMAAQENHDQVVKILLCNGANQSLATEDGFTPLAVAMQQGHDKVVSVLLENDSKGKVRLPALHIAAKKDDCKAADLLLQNDHKPDVTSKSGFTPLHIAAHYGNEEIGRLLIKRGADVNYLAKHNISPLHVAAKWGKNNMVKILLENSATIDSKTRDGLTPLHCAARSGHDSVVAALLENSAPISARTKNGLAPLHMASQGDHVDAARVLLYHRAPVDEVTIDYLTSLHVAAHCGHVRVAKLLLDRKADPNARALNGFTPLHIACKKNRIKVVELLIKHGASIESTTESGLTPLHVASFMGCMNIVIFLLQHEANPDVPTVRGETPLHLAARANQTDIIRILLRNGAKVDARAREQQTPLHVASRLGNVDIVMLLLQHGAAVDTTTKDMYTALHIAAKEGQEEVAAILVENNASLKATTKNGFTPLHIAAKYGNIKVAKILLQKDNALDAGGKNEITALHMACHYDHPGVAGLLLERGASAGVTSQNGHTPLHVAARKNQMEIASALLDHGANANAESKAGFTPLHLSAQKGHHDMTNLLVEHGADPNHKAKNGLTALHLCAQEDFVRVASILVKNGADVECCTESGYRPVHVAAHFGNPSMVRFLLKHNAEVDVKTNQDYTPLHQAAQQGHAHVASALIDGNASHTARTNDGLTALNIAQKLGYISVMEVLKGLPYDNLAPSNKNWEEKYKVVAPESLQEASFMSESDDEGGSDTLISEQPYRYLTADLMKSLRDDSLPIDVTRDDPIHRQVSKEDRQEFVQSSNYCSAENFDMQDNATVGRLHPRSFLVSFLVDARGGTMRGCRHSGIRIIVPPRRATMPLRVTCRLVKASKAPNPPPLMEGEALATRIVEMGPVGATFLGPVLIDVPHFASARGNEREIIILRSENGETWKEHDNSSDNDDTLVGTPHDAQMSASYSGRITRIMTTDFPQYFAIITRIKQEVHVIGSEGGILISSVVNQVQAVFPPGALTKKIKVGLQAHVIPYELTAKLLGNCVAVSPVITIEPRRRKFHKPITLSIPVPQAANKGMINQYGGETPTLRLLCSIAGGTSEAQWEDVTGSTPLTFMNDRVSFTTTVSARFWLMDCRNIGEVPKMATELYKESLFVPFVTNFVIYSKRMDLLEATLRILCMTDGKEGLHTLERQEEFLEIVKSRDVEALDGKDLYIEFSGNLIPVTKSGMQLKFTFKAFRQNRLSFHAKVKDPLLDPVARMLFMREPKVAKGEPSQQPICILNIVLPELLRKEKFQSGLRREKDYEDSNIISQKIDSYVSEREAEEREKSDDPKVVVASPLNERKFLVHANQKDRGDAANIHESLAQKAACPLETVDASYPNKIDVSKRELEGGSPDIIEKKTYSEKRKFWEEIGKRGDGNSMDQYESEVSQASFQSTTNETDHDGEYTKSSLATEEEEDEDREPEDVTADEMEGINNADVPDISECSVAEKAHYFEEQIQKELMIPAKTVSNTKVISDADSTKKEKPKERGGKGRGKDKSTSEITEDSQEYGSRIESIGGESGEPTNERQGDSQAAKLDSGIDGTKIHKIQLENAPSSYTTDVPSKPVIEICTDMLQEERKLASLHQQEDKVKFDYKTQDKSDLVIESSKEEESLSTLKSRDREESSTLAEALKLDTESRSIDKKIHSEFTAGSLTESNSDKEASQQLLIAETTTGDESMVSKEQSSHVKVNATIKEFESRIPKLVGSTKDEKETRVTKSSKVVIAGSKIPVTTEQKTSATNQPRLEEESLKECDNVAGGKAKAKESESRIPKRIAETPKHEKNETARDKIVEELKETFATAGQGASSDEEISSRFTRTLPKDIPDLGGVSHDFTESVKTEKKISHSVRKSSEKTSRIGVATKSTIDHRVLARTEEKEIVSSEITTPMGKTVLTEVEKEHSGEKESRRTESKLIEKSAAQRVEETRINKKDIEVDSKRETSVKLLDDGKAFVAEGSAIEKRLDSEERETFEVLENKHGLISNSTNASSSDGTVAYTSVKISGSPGFPKAEEDHRTGTTAATLIPESSYGIEEVSRGMGETLSKAGLREEIRDVSSKESEARDIAETIIRSIQSEIENRTMDGENSLIRKSAGWEMEREERDGEKLCRTESIEANVSRRFGMDSKQESISITEDLTKDEESSPRSRDREGSLGFETSSGRLAYERDMTVSPSTASDHTDMEDLMEGDSNEVGEALRPQPQPKTIVDQKSERTPVFSRKESFDELSTRDTADVRTSGARVLEIIEPGYQESATSQISLSSVKISSSNTMLEKTDSTSDSILNEDVGNDDDEVLPREIRNLPTDSPPLISPKTRIKSLEIKPVDWMIGDEKIEISEPLQPSQVFNQELEEYESVVKQLSLEQGDRDKDEETVPTWRVDTSSPHEDTGPTISQRISKETPRTKFTVIPVSDKQLESELVENNLDISCQELMDALQKEFEAKTPTENFVSETSGVESWHENETKFDPKKTDVQDSNTGEHGPGGMGKNESEVKEPSKSSDDEKSIGDKEVAGGRRSASIPETLGNNRDAKEHAGVSTTSKAKKDAEGTSLDLSARYAITVLDQVVRKEIAEVKESLEAAKQDLIEELSENSETVFQIKDSPSEFQFKLQPESIPNELPFLYKAEPSNEQVKTQDVGWSSPVAKPRNTREDSKPENDENLGFEGDKIGGKNEEDARRGGEVKLELELNTGRKELGVSGRGMVANTGTEYGDVPSDADHVPVPASRTSSDAEAKDDGFLMCPPQPAPRRRHKPARVSKKMKSDSETDVGSSSGESSYQPCDYETEGNSRPSSSDIEVMQSGLPSGTASEYETALMSMENSSASRPTSQDYHTAISSLSSRESMKSLNSESSGHLASIESSSELSETLVPSEGDVEKDNLDENADHVLEDDGSIADARLSGLKLSYSSDSDNIIPSHVEKDTKEGDLDTSLPCRMKRSSEMIFQQNDQSGKDDDTVETTAIEDESCQELDTSCENKLGSKCIDNATSTTLVDSNISSTQSPLQSVDMTTSRVEEDGVQSVCTQVTSRNQSIPDDATVSRIEESISSIAAVPIIQDSSDDNVGVLKTVEGDSDERVYVVDESDETAEALQRPDLTLIQQTSMSTSSTSGMSLETVVDNKDRQDRRSPDSDSFELVDKPDIIDDFVVIEEVGREAEEFDSEGKSICISSSGMICTGVKNYDREVENLITSNKDEGKGQSAGQPARNNELFDFDSEESPPQASNDDQLYSQSYSDEEQYEGGKKWVEMQFQTDARGYEIDYDRGPLEDIKEEEITDFEAGSSRFGSLGSHKESVGSVGSARASLGSTPEYDVLAGRKYFTKPSEHDNLSLSSLQEFENLETAMAMENSKKVLCGSQDSINNGSLPRRHVASRSGHGDDISLSSLKDFEGLETACREAHMIELRAREEEDLLDHESPENRYKIESLARARAESSAPASFNPSTSGSDDYEKRIKEIDEIIRIAQSNVEKFDRQDDTADDISQIEITETDSRGLGGGGGASQGPGSVSGGHGKGVETTGGSPRPAAIRQKDGNIMETSTDSLELDDQDMDKRRDPLCRSSDSLELKTTLDLPSLSSDSLNNTREAREPGPGIIEQFDNSCRRISSDSLEIPFSEQLENNYSIPGKPEEEKRGNRNHTEMRTETDNSSTNEAGSHTNISLVNTSSNNGT